MAVTGNDLEHWHQALAGMIAQGFGEHSWPDLLAILEKLSKAGRLSAVWVKPPGHSIYCYWHNLESERAVKFSIDAYADGAYLLDPLSVVDEEGVFTLREVAPDGFEESEYYRVFCLSAGFQDEACLLIRDAQYGLVSISLLRQVSERPFAAEDKAILKAVFPVVKSIVNQCFNASSLPPEAHTVKTQLDSALENFGASLLTDRECEIAQLLLKGHSLKSISQRLGNSDETIKSHKKHIYQKLDIGSQAELFHLFLDSLRCNSLVVGEDPLVAYLSVG